MPKKPKRSDVKIDWSAPGPHTPMAAAAAIALFDAISVEPAVKLRLLADCAERVRRKINSGSTKATR